MTDKKSEMFQCILSDEELGYITEFQKAAGMKDETTDEFVIRIAVTQAIQYLEGQRLEAEQREAQQRMQQKVMAKLKELYENNKGE